MPSIRSSILIFACAVVGGGCVGAAAVFDPSDLQKPTVDRTIRLDEDYTFENRLGGINNVLARGTILSGRYQAQYEDPAGGYFLGPKVCVRIVYIDSNAPGRVADCGIYLPNAKDLPPRMYIYTDASPQSADTTSLAAQENPKGAPIGASAVGGALAGAIVDAVIASDQGKPRFLGQKVQPPGPEFRARLKTD